MKNGRCAKRIKRKFDDRWSRKINVYVGDVTVLIQDPVFSSLFSFHYGKWFHSIPQIPRLYLWPLTFTKDLRCKFSCRLVSQQIRWLVLLHWYYNLMYKMSVHLAISFNYLPALSLCTNYWHLIKQITGQHCIKLDGVFLCKTCCLCISI